MTLTKLPLLTGITGQEGSYPAELLLNKGYEVHGLIRRASTFDTSRIDHIYKDWHEADPQLTWHDSDLTDGSRLVTLLAAIRPDEVYNLAAQSNVRISFGEHEFTGTTTGMGTTSARGHPVDRPGLPLPPGIVVGDVRSNPTAAEPEHDFLPSLPLRCGEGLLLLDHPQPPRGYGVFAVNGILFNRESPRRGETFVTRKTSRVAARVKAGLDKELYLDSGRDWGYAKEYVEAMWLMLRQDEATEYVVASSTAYTVRQSLDFTFGHLDLDRRDFVKFDDRCVRPTEVHAPIGDPVKAEAKLGWKPHVFTPELARIMEDSDLELAKREKRACG